ncbi:hypothetical protein [Palleronia pelagia]|uniref:hypothetical protein n=1 Tax=Palleronia pelagia TaxID=387096 RepID=UPI0011144314|nr:hypothetical protein [Palleronia pelagia]
MSRKLDWEDARSNRLLASRGYQRVGPEALTEKERHALEEGAERNSRKAARMVDDLRSRSNEIVPVDAPRQISNLEFLYRQLDPEQKRSKKYGRFLKSQIASLKVPAGRVGSEQLVKRAKVTR